MAGVLEDRLLREFAERLDAEAEEALEELGPGFRMARDVALLQAAMGYISDTGAAASDDLCPHEDTEGRDRCRVLAYSIDEDERRLLLFTALHRPVHPHDEIPVLPREEVTKLAHRAARFFRAAARRDTARFAGNAVAEAAAKEIRRNLERIDDVHVTFVTNVRVRDRAIEPSEEIGKPIVFDVWDLERIHRSGADAVTRERILVDFDAIMGRPLPVLEMEPPATEYQTFLAVVPGEALFRLYEDYGARLFEFNVRSYLQATGKVNKGIRATLAHAAERERFLAYNNGITATADEIDVVTEHGRTVIRSVRGLQIVNGAQTTASIHRARKQDKVDLTGVAVAMKLTRVKDDKLAEFVPLISRYANTQNPVQAADLSANSDFHVRLEQLSEKLWCPGEESRWFYERARGAYQVARIRNGNTKAKKAEFDAECPKGQRFGKTDLAKAWMSWWGLPHVVGRGSQKNYLAFMGEMETRHGVGYLPDEDFLRHTAAILLLFRAAQKACREADLGSYAANVVTLMIARLADEHGEEIDLDAIWDAQGVSDELRELMLKWAPLLHEALRAGAGSQNVTEFAKKETSWDAIRKLRLAWPAEGVPETQVEEAPPVTTAPAVPTAPVPPTRATAAPPAAPVEDDGDDEDLIAQCTALDGAAWGRIMGWAAASPYVAPYDRRVTNTITSYAMEGWPRRPSPKQARIMARVLAAARKAGVINLAA